MRTIYILILLTIPFSIFGQTIDKILYRGDSVLVYPTDSITMVDIKLIDSLPNGFYCGFFKGDTAFLRLEINYQNHRIDGKVIEYYYENRDIKKITEFKNGIRDGYWVEYDYFADYKEILHEGYYKNGLEEGFQYSYHGEIGDRSIYNKCFYKSDTLIYNIWYGRDSTFYKNDTGFVYQFDRNKNLVGHGKEFKNKKIGKWKYFCTNGNTKSIGKYEIVENHESFLQDRKTGLWRDYHENGQISREYICDSKKSGSWILTIISQYDSIGNLIDSLNFVDGQGLQRDFYSDGKVRNELYYPDSSFLEYEKNYSPSGNLVYKEEFTREKKKTRTEYFENGNIKSIERFICFSEKNHVPFDDYLIFGKQEYFNEDGTIKRIDKIKKPQYIE
jgi:antitoxin component YwqK of YwqJK toxin-antitoxin module